MSRAKWVVFVVGAFATALVAAPAGAVWTPGLPGTPAVGVPTEVVLSATGAGHAVNGFIGPVGSVSNPAVPYPTTDPPGFTAQNEGFAGVIEATPVGGGTPLQMYCINIRTLTAVGYGYNLGEWSAANVSNVGYVARLLNSYYPNTAAPAIGSNGIADANDQAAAVQAAIWYFSDNFVVSTTEALRPAVAAIVEAVRAAGPLANPTPPSLQLSPTSATGEASTAVGPFTVSTDDPTGARVSASGGTLTSDAAGTIPIANGTVLPNGATLFVQRTTEGEVTISAVALAVVPGGNAYLYSGNIEGVTDAQKLILAGAATLSTTVSATATFTAETTTTTTTTTTTSTTTTTTTAPTTTTSASTTTTSASTSVPGTTTTTVPAGTTTSTAAVGPIATGTLPTTGGGTSSAQVTLAAVLAALAGLWLVLLTRRRHA